MDALHQFIDRVRTEADLQRLFIDNPGLALQKHGVVMDDGAARRLRDLMLSQAPGRDDLPSMEFLGIASRRPVS
jgi:hypothetical protein